MNNYVKVELTEQQASQFIEFQRRYETINYLLGYMESVKIYDMKNAHIELDINNKGIIEHMSITKHFRI